MVALKYGLGLYWVGDSWLSSCAMTGRKNGLRVRSTAMRKAADAHARRAARRAEHELNVKAAVAADCGRTDRAESAQADGQRRIAQILASVEAEVRALEAEAREALRRLRALGEPVVEIADLTGLSVGAIRAALGARDTSSTGTASRG